MRTVNTALVAYDDVPRWVLIEPPGGYYSSVECMLFRSYITLHLSGACVK